LARIGFPMIGRSGWIPVLLVFLPPMVGLAPQPSWKLFDIWIFDFNF